ncbi:2OG-Fe(II) oxygenase [Sphaerisporangium fuscum]|uniref:2OG-Fe(II) oxygenase n=1 Tax=Sphaerisporangium fuscum TaxID=2835868 RepID=UPI001BDC2C00|nr:2OG-Fe(II) oxygenase [Sphaerisporangium fuscum]
MPDFSMYVQRELLTPQECQELIDVADAIDLWGEYEVPVDEVGNGVRQSVFDLRIQFEDLHDSVLAFLTEINAEHWNFAIDGWNQPLRIARYFPGYRHDWHTDYTGADASKLAFSMPLNSDYQGGELQLLECERIGQKLGHALVFPAFQGHRVTEVTEGVRYVLLGWLTGPRFV